MKQSKLTTTGLDAKQGMFLFFLFFSLFKHFSQTEQDNQTTQLLCLSHITETCMGRVLADVFD